MVPIGGRWLRRAFSCLAVLASAEGHVRQQPPNQTAEMTSRYTPATFGATVNPIRLVVRNSERQLMAAAGGSVEIS